MSEFQNHSAVEVNGLAAGFKNALGAFISKRFETFLAGVSDGQLALTWPNGSTTYHGTRSEVANRNAQVTLHSLQPIRRLAIGGDVGFAESYMDGEWSTECLLNLFHLIMRNEATVKKVISGSFRSRFARFIKHWLNRNSKEGSQRNIAYHYDLGNAFYHLWLDSSMSYSSAFYEHEDESLSVAQVKKMSKVRQMMQPHRGDTVLEIGCGWGALAHYMGTQAGVHVDGISLSSEQLAYAREHNSLVASKSSGATSFYHQDYREVNETYDHIMSIEMFEAVGEQYWETYFEQLRKLLKVDGCAVLQVITIDESRFDRYQKKPDFIQRYIFPGGMLPTKTHLYALAEKAGFEIDESHWFGESYARTLAAWRNNFEKAEHGIRSEGFDDRFIRMWRYYLVYCQTGFTFGTTDVGLLKLKKRR